MIMARIVSAELTSIVACAGDLQADESDDTASEPNRNQDSPGWFSARPRRTNVVFRALPTVERSR
jgi:hypothetical protein